MIVVVSECLKFRCLTETTVIMAIVNIRIYSRHLLSESQDSLKVPGLQLNCEISAAIVEVRLRRGRGYVSKGIVSESP